VNNVICFNCGKRSVVEDNVKKCPYCGGNIKILGKSLGFNGEAKTLVRKDWK